MVETLSFEEQLTFAHQMTRLELWSLREWLERHPEESTADVLRNRTNIYLRSDFHGGRRFKLITWTKPRWLALEEGLCRLVNARGTFNAKHAEQFRRGGSG